MELEIVLDGGLKSCCTTYSTDYIREVVTDWMGDTCVVSVVDTIDGKWKPDDTAAKAIYYFKEEAYPFTYVDGRLMTSGNLPTKSQIIAFLDDKKHPGLTTEDVIEAARQSGKYEIASEV